jgi:hypothetical protein
MTTSTAGVQVQVLWDRTKQRFPTSFLGRKDFQVYRLIEEDVLSHYHHLRFYEEH